MGELEVGESASLTRTSPSWAVIESATVGPEEPDWMPRVRVLLYLLIFEPDPMAERRVQMALPYALREPEAYRRSITAALASGLDLADVLPGVLSQSDEVLREFLAEVLRRLPPAF